MEEVGIRAKSALLVVSVLDKRDAFELSSARHD